MRVKTDAVDARMLARMGSALELVPDAPAAEDQNNLKELQIARTALVKDRTRLKNRLKTQTLAFTRRQMQARLAQIERQLTALQGEMERLINTCPKRTRAYAILRSIGGIDQVAAAAILIECPEIGALGKKQIAPLAGLAPMTRQSGTWKGKAFIQGGRKHLRDALYMPALVESRFNPDMRDKYLAMIKAGKPAKFALTAIMRKLIELANALIKADRKWKPKLA
uniref:IS110 family transposase n=1 Tax=Pararhizobium sp. IMCC3301 TaxID=3067904 RepID=UPI003531B19D